MIGATIFTISVFVAGCGGYVASSLINGSEKEHLRERCGELETALDDAGRTLLCHGFVRAAQRAMKALGRPVLEDGQC